MASTLLSGTLRNTHRSQSPREAGSFHLTAVEQASPRQATPVAKPNHLAMGHYRNNTHRVGWLITLIREVNILCLHPRRVRSPEEFAESVDQVTAVILSRLHNPSSLERRFIEDVVLRFRGVETFANFAESAPANDVPTGNIKV